MSFDAYFPLTGLQTKPEIVIALDKDMLFGSEILEKGFVKVEKAYL